MKLENQQFLNDNRHHYDLLNQAGIVKHLDMATRQILLNVIHEEFNPGYLGQLWCQSCIADMITFAYVQYDKWIEANPVVIIAGIESIEVSPVSLDGAVKVETFPAADMPKKKRRGKRKATKP